MSCQAWRVGFVIAVLPAAQASCGSLESVPAPSPHGCDAAATPIGAVQGASESSPLAGQTLEVLGVVTLSQAAGFYLQSETPDDDALTSEALFVRAGPAALVQGSRARVRGRVAEADGATELHAIELIQPCGTAEPSAEATFLDSGAGLERWEHMWLRSRDSWTLIDTTERATPKLSRVGRLFAAGHELGEDADADALELWSLELPADEPSKAGPAPRLGSRAEALSGVVALGGARGPRLLLDRAPSWREPDAPAPAAPAADVLRVAALNVHNYFAELGGRGAASEGELARQRTKLVAALSALRADVLGLVEVGNSVLSVEHLAAGLNAGRSPDQRYLWSSVAAPPDSPIRAVLFHRADRVETVGAAWLELDPVFTRPPLFQRLRREGAELTLGVVHFKSKRCDGEPPASELEGCGADQRRAEALALAGIASELMTQRVLLVGDFNADSREAPLAALEGAGLMDLLGAVPAAERYSYVFDARATLLDHAFASPTLAREAVAASIWHIGADEPSTRGYSLHNPPDHYAPDARRCSDHDPISVDLRF